MSNNRKRIASRKIQTIKCADIIIRDGEKIKNPDAGKLKQIKHLNILA
jgi:hypothetical protein